MFQTNILKFAVMNCVIFERRMSKYKVHTFYVAAELGINILVKLFTNIVNLFANVGIVITARVFMSN